MTKNEEILWLSSIPEIGPLSIAKLMQKYNDPEYIFAASPEELMETVPKKMAQRICEFSERDCLIKIEEIMNKLDEGGYSFLTFYDEDYPERLKNIPNPPQILYFKGDKELLNKGRCVAIVGSRQATEYGREAALYFAGELSGAGFTVVSGLAYGIDTAAHRGAIQNGGKTIGVMGSGINDIYPKGNLHLYEEMYSSQLVISENGPGIPSYAFNFPVRNRIISGLSEGVIVVEAREKSGSLITADIALEQGRNVYAVPGRITDPMNKGTNNLIAQGALIANDADTVIADLLGASETEDAYQKKWKENKKKETDKKEREYLELSENERKIFNCLSGEPMFIDDITSVSGLSLTLALEGLIKLEKKKLIKAVERGYYVKKI
ncbi:DNA processing protein [Eubacterium ruminantium]|nr:DNA processing protein [Eubacterium ruminantium]